MRFLVDEDLPRSLVRCLLTAGFDALDVRDAGLRGRSDPEIAAQARADRRALVSADLGFANVLKYPTGSHPGIVIVRFPNEIPVAALCEAVVRALAGLSEEELGAALIILFERLDPRVEGSGVGLAIVRRIVEFHGGRIRVESEGVPGEGSRFCLVLPGPATHTPGSAAAPVR